MKTIFCLFPDIDNAVTAVNELIEKRLPGGEMNVIVQEQTAKNYLTINPRATNIPVTGKEGNLPTLDKMLKGKQPVKLPDTGKVFVAGELANIMSRTASASVTGQTAGNLESTLVDFGLSKNTARRYHEGIKGGGLLFFLRTSDERASEVASTLRNQDGSNLVSSVG